MRFFKKTTLEANELGRVTHTDVHIVDAEDNRDAEQVLESVARDLQANSFSVYWGFDEESIKVVHNNYPDIIRYITVTEL